PVVSNLSGRVAGEEIRTPEYWVRHVREAVRFADGIAALAESGVTKFLELGPDATLTAMAAENADGLFVPATRRGHDEVDTFTQALSRLWVSGVDVDWAALFADRNPHRVDLPTYAFQRERYWLESAGPTGDPVGLGQGAAGHPLMGAAVSLAADGGVMLTGRLSLRTHSWLADHAVSGTFLFPGTGFVELAIRAGDEVGCAHLAELTLQAPLILPAQNGVQVQVVVGAVDEDGRRRVTVYSRPETAEAWTAHAEGVLAQAPADPPAALTVWPPAGAEPVDVSGFYAAAGAAGYGYGPAFQGMTAAWRRGDELFAEVELAEELHAEAGEFGVHPALLDASLHAVLATAEPSEGLRLPFLWEGVSLLASGATAARVRITTLGGDALSVFLADGTGAPIAAADSLTLRPVTAEQLTSSLATETDSLYRLMWESVPQSADADVAGDWAVIGTAEEGGYVDLAALLDGVSSVPPLVLFTPPAGGDPETTTANVLTLVQSWLGEERLAGSRLVVVTRGAVAIDGGDLADLATAPVWGLVRSAQSEYPERFVLLDLDPTADGDDAAVVRSALASGEPQLAFREGRVLVPRLVRAAGSGGSLVVPAGESAWRLDTSGSGTLDGLALVPAPEAAAPLESGQVRISVRAAGVNFRDVLIGLGMYPGEAFIGSEIAGVVVETAEDVAEFAAGDRVLGLVPRSFGPLAVADARVVVRVPEGWSFEQAATVPVVFLTAYYGLVDLGRVRAGETVLVHAGAGGVGMAAVQLARHLGARVLATASPGKWEVLRGLGLGDDQIASSRDLGFRESFAGAGVDVVLNSLAGEYVDASLDLLTSGGRFLEMGKTDVRVGVERPGVEYVAFDMLDAGPVRIGEMLRALLGLFESGVLEPLPVRAWDVRRAPEAFRFISQAKHVGKVALTMPVLLDPDGTVLVTGGTGTLGALLARHLVTAYGVRNLLLTSRRGLDTPGAPELARELGQLGAAVEVVACDAADRDQLAGLLESRTLTGVVHAAGVLADGLVTALTPEDLARVWRPKAQAALHLHELTRDSDLAFFALYSSASGVFGGAGQANYAAANTFLDALAHHRRAQGLPATSLAWGFWAETSALTSSLGESGQARMTQGGMLPLTTERGVALFDAATGSDGAVAVAAALDTGGLRDRAPQHVPAFLRELVTVTRRRRGTAANEVVESASGLVRRLAGLDPAGRDEALRELVRSHVAVVLGHSDAAALDTAREFVALGFDSLTAVELRNRLGTATGLALPATLIFDHRTPEALARYLSGELAGSGEAADGGPVTAESRPADPDSLSGIFLRACREGRFAEISTVLRTAADFRENFSGPAELAKLPQLTPLARGARAPQLICFPTFAWKPSVYQYLPFASALSGARTVSALSLPGFMTGEAIPADLDALVRTLAEAIRQNAGDEPYALLGYS
ncbi:KR domain-containing protein, partial [Streptomyces sp. NPDC058642]|uniref:KR domain-containing protein n=1 Tax=Streptomyces sp. NPDC058642 TaxID=3346572 RepID=UPI00365A31BF